MKGETQDQEQTDRPFRFVPVSMATPLRGNVDAVLESKT